MIAYGVAGCRCYPDRVNTVDGEVFSWMPAAHCPHHGLTTEVRVSPADDLSTPPDGGRVTEGGAQVLVDVGDALRRAFADYQPPYTHGGYIPKGVGAIEDRPVTTRKERRGLLAAGYRRVRGWYWNWTCRGL